MTVRCQQHFLFLSQTCHGFESDFPCFDSDIPCLESDLCIFRYSSSHFSNESFPLFKSVLLIFRVRTSHFLGSILFTFRFSCQSFSFFRVSPLHFFKSVLLIFRVRTSNFFWVSPFHFSKWFLLIFEWDFPNFLGQFIPLIQVSPSYISSQTFPFFGSVLPTFPSQTIPFWSQTF